jgi:hypothetical protein
MPMLAIEARGGEALAEATVAGPPLAPSPELRRWFGHDPAKFPTSFVAATPTSSEPTRRSCASYADVPAPER